MSNPIKSAPWSLFAAAVILASAGCSKSVRPPPGREAVSPGAGAPAADLPAGHLAVHGEGFTIEVQAPKLEAGPSTSVVIAIRPSPPFHLNHDYPTELELTAPAGIELERTLLRNGPDAREAVVWDDDLGIFRIRATTSPLAPGAAVRAQLRFAICTDTSCDPKTGDFSVPLVAN